MSSKRIKLTSDQESEKCVKELAELRKRKENVHCAECGKTGPTWCSLNLGVFICIRCTSAHRSLGCHISRVKSSMLDRWTTKELKQFKKGGGNVKVNSIYEAKLKEAKPSATSETHEIETFVKDKYERKRWYSKKRARRAEEEQQQEVALDDLDDAEAEEASSVSENTASTGTLKTEDLLHFDDFTVTPSPVAPTPTPTATVQAKEDDVWADFPELGEAPASAPPVFQRAEIMAPPKKSDKESIMSMFKTTPSPMMQGRQHQYPQVFTQLQPLQPGYPMAGSSPTTNNAYYPGTPTILPFVPRKQ